MKPKFKKGDEVRCIHRPDLLHVYAGAGWKEGKIFKIFNTYNCGNDHKFCYFPRSGYGIYEDFLTLNKPKWSEKFR